jgi:hypothetical protein
LSSSDGSVDAFEEERLSVRAEKFRSEAKGKESSLSFLARKIVDILEDVSDELGGE